MSPDHFNPLSPYVLGNEYPALHRWTVPLGQGSERGHTLRSYSAEAVDSLRVYFADDVPTDYRFFLLSHVYRKGDESFIGEVTTDAWAPSATSGVGGAVGVGSDLNGSLQSPSDNAYVHFASGGDRVDMSFDTTSYAGRRILSLALKTQIWYDNVPLPDGQVAPFMRLLMHDSGGGFAQWGEVRGDVFLERPQIRTTGLGEINPLSDVGSVPDRWPWTATDLQAFGAGGPFTVSLEAEATPDIRLYFVQLLVTWCAENRIAVAAKRFGASGGGTEEEAATVGRHDLLYRSPDGALAYFDKQSGQDYAVTVCAADTGGPYHHDNPTAVRISVMETYGPFANASALDSFEPFEPHLGIAAVRNSTNELLPFEYGSVALPVVIAAGGAASADAFPYRARRLLPVYAGVQAGQYVVQENPGNITYPMCRLYARKVGDVDSDLVVALDSSHQATITAGQFDALPELTGDGFKRLDVPFNLAPPVDNSGTPVLFTISTFGGDSANRWEVLGESSPALDETATYQDTQGEAWNSSTGAMAATDLAFDIYSLPDPVASISATRLILPLPIEANEPCLRTPGGFSTDGRRIGQFPFVAYAGITWPIDGDFALFSHYELQRADHFDLVFRTIARLHGPSSNFFTDFEWRVQKSSYYRVRKVRDDGAAGPWSPQAAVVNDEPSPATEGDFYGPGTLVLTSNVNPTLTIATTCAYDEPVNAWAFPESETVHYDRFYGRDDQVAFRGLERGGTKFQRTLLLNPRRLVARNRPGNAHYSEDTAFEELRDLAWADLPYVCVCDDYGHRWFASVRVPEGTTRRRQGSLTASLDDPRAEIVLASIEVTEASAEPFVVDRTPVGGVIPSIFLSPSHGTS